MTETKTEPVTREPSARERIATLEQEVAQLNLKNLNIDMGLEKLVTIYNSEIIKLSQENKRLSLTLEALISVLNNDEKPSDDNLNSVMENMRITQIKTQIEKSVQKGELKPIDEIEENAFIIGQTINKETSEILDPMYQFPLQNVSVDNHKLYLGKKPGDLIDVGQNLIFKILEIYLIIKQDTKEQENVSEKN
jgi:hypothetical protein